MECIQFCDVADFENEEVRAVRCLFVQELRDSVHPVVGVVAKRVPVLEGQQTRLVLTAIHRFEK